MVSNIKKIYFSKQIKISYNDYNEGCNKYKDKSLKELILKLLKYIELSKKSDFILTKNCIIIENIYKQINTNRLKLLENNIYVKKIELIE